MAAQRGEEVLRFPSSRRGDGAMKMHSKAWNGAGTSAPVPRLAAQLLLPVGSPSVAVGGL